MNFVPVKTGNVNKRMMQQSIIWLAKVEDEEAAGEAEDGAEVEVRRGNMT